MLARGTLVSALRSILLQRFLKAEGFTHCIFIDSDMVFKPDWIYKLVQHDKPVVAGIARCRGFGFWNAFDYNKVDRKYEPLTEQKLRSLWGLTKVDAVGFAFVLMRRDAVEDVFNKYSGAIQQLEKIYLENLDTPILSTLFKSMGSQHTVFNTIGKKGEDILFCELLRDCGIPIFIDPEIRCGHEVTTVLADPLAKEEEIV